MRRQLAEREQCVVDRLVGVVVTLAQVTSTNPAAGGAAHDAVYGTPKPVEDLDPPRAELRDEGVRVLR
jgi:hypothetical protein